MNDSANTNLNTDFKENHSTNSSLLNLRIINSILFIVNIVLAYLVGENVVASSTPHIAGITYSVIRALLIPLFVVFFFQMGKRFRSKIHRHYIFLATSIIIFISVSSGFSLIANQ